jgi:hypothetical protein
MLVAALVAAASIAGIWLPEVYRAETASWAAQAVGQDWVNLLIAAPSLVFAAASSRRSRRSLLVCAGLLVYTLYSYVIYAFAVHFNRLFPVYCAIVGLSFFELAALSARLLREDPGAWYRSRAPARLAGGYQIAVGALFAALWLAEIGPAVIAGRPPATLAAVGLATNPVHVLDLSVVLPAMILGGLALVRRRPLGHFLVPVMLSFGLIMSAAIEGMFLVMYLRGVATDPAGAILMAIVLAATSVVLVLLLACVRRSWVDSGGSVPAQP